MENLHALFSDAALQEAWQKVRSKGKSGGIDNISITEFESDLAKNLKSLRAEVIAGNYVPEPYKLFFIEKENKPKKELRPLALMTIRDKITQHVIALHYSPLFEKKFIDTSYAYRSGKGHPKAIARVADFLNRKFTFVANLDIDNFFDTINRKTLFNACSEWFSQPEILKLLEMWVLTGFVHHGKYIKSETGIAQGGVLSPLLSNIYLHPLDQILFDNAISNVRYADNIILFGKSKQEVLARKKFVADFISSQLSLRLNDSAGDAVSVSDGFDFCGINFAEGKRSIAQAKLLQIKTKIKTNIQKHDIKTALELLKETFDGLNRYYSPYDTEEQLAEIRQTFTNSLAAKIINLLNQKVIKNEQEVHALLKNFPQIIFGDSGNKLFIKSISGTIKGIKSGTRTNGEILGNEHPSGSISPQPSAPPATGEEVATSAPLTAIKDHEKEARRLVEKKRKVYYNKFVASLDLMVSGNFAHIGKAGGKIVIRREGKIVAETFAGKLTSLIISSKGATISSDAMRLCMENNVSVCYFDELGKPYAVVFPVASGANSVSTAQARAAGTVTGRRIVQSLVWGKISNQIALIRYLTKNKNLSAEQAATISKSLVEMEAILKKVAALPVSTSAENYRNILFGHEGSAAVSYWSALKMLIPPGYGFTVREHQNAANVVNQMLNYGYGILYSKVLAAAVVAGLNPNIPFLHAEVKGKPALTFDLIEPFRPVVVDRTVLSILSRSSGFSSKSGKLPDDLRKKIASKVLARLYSEVKYKGHTMSVNDILILNSKQIAAVLKEEEKTYKPYVMKW